MVAAVAFFLYVFWSNSFIAVGYLLGSDGGGRRFGWVGLTVARFLPASLICAGYCLGWRRAESWAILRTHWARVAVCSALAVPGYNFALYYGQQHGVAAPIASLLTTLVPLFLLILSALLLGEQLTPRRIVGLAIALGGMLIVSQARVAAAAAYPLMVAITALAPLGWSLFSVLSKPMTERYSPVLWTFLVLAVAAPPLLLAVPFTGGPEMARLDAAGWFAVLFLSLLCTVLGFALWNWLLGQLPASSVGFFVFLNPPMTTLSKLLLALALPATFSFAIASREWIGGAVTLAGVALALTQSEAARSRQSTAVGVQPGAGALPGA
ncbi:MAG TPA: DMT family transporter [Thermoanaerobaculia bacterium]|nr:DMT family transporter [Thermoanaerobaculia bacterium]